MIMKQKEFHSKLMNNIKSPMKELFSSSSHKRFNSVSRTIRNHAKKEGVDLKQSEIDRQNKILVNRMTEIIKGKSSSVMGFAPSGAKTTKKAAEKLIPNDKPNAIAENEQNTS